VGAREGVVERTEREMIHRVFELENTLVREVMVPRLDMFCLDVTRRRGDPRLLREHLHSRVPVFEGSVDQIVGVLYTKDLLPTLAGCPRTSTCARICTRRTSCRSPSGPTRCSGSSRPRSSTSRSSSTSTAAPPGW
jgi:CBS domain containing-hemolysin-like protein